MCAITYRKIFEATIKVNLPMLIHLHVHSEYSLIDGLVRLDELVARCVALKMPAVACTDHQNFFGAIKFYQAAIAAGVKPLIGAEVLIENVLLPGQYSKVLLLCQNQQGYHHLSQLLTRIYLEGQTGAQVHLKESWLEEYSEGLIAIGLGMQEYSDQAFQILDAILS